MPKAVIESLAAGCALLTTRRGGIPEVADGRAHVVDTPSIAHFSAAFEKLLTDDAYRKSLQDAAWHDFPFTANAMADDADARARNVSWPRTDRSCLYWDVTILAYVIDLWGKTR